MKPVLSKLKLKRLLICKTQQEVAETIGVSRVYIAHLENGREPLRGSILKKLADYYRCSMADLI
ncbi:helix-turn-helix transcriptional regulator [Sporomusa sphaeroides DSM 2875]|uniref:helix-turn-helix domain-containing protein n=1 Tax=Sporomusa sphaeroides TaxID=47679 RepID=UPI0020307506|nr:helix-turn-helix transcriptional regulator [Sporomusa sphaeroides]MCM0758502.1 helix-turn-helix transcriptional regulator [Sporomusa sphaeroides DSM 2875]